MEAITPQPTVARNWYEIWWDVWVHPGAATFRRILQEPNTGYLRGFLWTVSMAFIGIWPGTLISLIFRQNIAPITISGFLNSLLFSSIIYPVMAVVVLAIAAAIYHWIAKLFGGKGAWSQLVFCLSAIQAPAYLFSALSSFLIGLITGSLQYQSPQAIPQQMTLYSVCLAFPATILSIYLIVLFVSAIQGVEGINTGKAIATYFAPMVAGILVGCCLVSGVIFTGGVLRSANDIRSTRISVPTNTSWDMVVGGSWDPIFTGLPARSTISSLQLFFPWRLILSTQPPCTLEQMATGFINTATEGNIRWEDNCEKAT